MKLLIGIGLALAIANAHETGHPHHHHDHGEMMHHGHDEAFHNRPNSHVMFHHVETACAADVDALCVSPQGAQLRSTGDPFLDWIFLPFAPPPPEIQDFTMMMDRLFDPTFLEPSREYVTLYFVQEPQHGPHFLVDSAAAKAAKELEPEEIPQLANDLQNYGSELLTRLDDGSSFHYQMARRLTEMDARTIQHHVSLPFGCSKNQCLRRAFVEGKLSPACRSSIERLESTFSLEIELEQRQEWFFGMMIFYLCTLLVLSMMIRRKMGALRYNKLLGERILQAVYSNPATRRQVELDLGQSVGSAPPLPPVGLRTPEARAFIKRVQVAVVAILVALVIFAPFWVLPACIMLSCVRVVRLCLRPTQTSVCTCCCCGSTTADAANGNLTQDQECCSCCKGTGVCAPACSDCCGPTGSCSCYDDASCCCEEKYTRSSCCGNVAVQECETGAGECFMKGRGEKHVISARNEVYCGVPVQVV